MTRWRTIDSAPKDGTKIFLGYSSDDRNQCFYEGDCYWHLGQWHTWAMDGFETMGNCQVSFTPNCWHPMPDDPPPNIEGIKPCVVDNSHLSKKTHPNQR